MSYVSDFSDKEKNELERRRKELIAINKGMYTSDSQIKELKNAIEQTRKLLFK